MSAEKLYTPQVLALATRLAAWPWDEGLTLRGEARSRSCGSTLRLALSTDSSGKIDSVGLKAHACAIGQAAAAVFAETAIGRSATDIAEAADALEVWLSGVAGLPDWPGIEALAAARDYPARHGAIRLAWEAARQALPTDARPR